MIESTSWISQAICKGYTHLFFSSSRETARDRRLRQRQAINICHQCPVMFECRNYARKNNEYGIWGGETEEYRFSLGYAPVGFRRKKRFSNNLDTKNNDQLKD